MRRRLDTSGYVEVKTPQLMDARQWEKSGHWGKYRENMFVVPDEIPNPEEEGPVISGTGDWMALKPMNCPGHILIFKQGITSYKELPIRLASERPSTSFMVKNGRPSSVPRSCTGTTPGCSRSPVTRASFKKRAIRSLPARTCSSEDKSERIVLSATCRRRSRSKAQYTTPIPPCPICVWIS